MLKNPVLFLGVVLLLSASACSPAKIVAVALTLAAGPADTDVPASTWTPVSVSLPAMTDAPEAAPNEITLPAPASPADTQAPADLSPTEAPSVQALTPASTATLDPYAQLSIDYLTTRLYGLDGFQIETVLDSNSYFTRTLITYPSDGRRIFGFMDTPRRSKPPFPVVIAVHGYIDPSSNQTLDYTTAYADALARAGYLVIYPNLRDYPPSDNGPDLFGVSMAVDVLNLISIVKAQAGNPGALEPANPRAIVLWGSSMGGGIVLRVITVSKDVRAALLYGSMSGDEKQNYQAIYLVREYGQPSGAGSLTMSSRLSHPSIISTVSQPRSVSIMVKQTLGCLSPGRWIYLESCKP